MQYHPNPIEKKWQEIWAKNQTFKAENQSTKPKYYVLDMFPYPSGAGLHVGHPLGYIASDIYARYKRHKGFNVLHPMGYDSFGLPAEQYAIQTGQHPDKTTKENVARYRKQLDKMGFSFDWSREVRTSNTDYYRWTQWIFLQLFDSFYCYDDQKAKPIADLEEHLQENGTDGLNVACDDDTPQISAEEWNKYSEKEKQEFLLKFRLTYLAEAEVNWCPALGTVLANDEVVNGVSERGGHPVVRKKMTQWMMRITAYAERLLNGITYNEKELDWSDALKESQKNWIGKSKGAQVQFKVLSPTLSKGKGVDMFGYMTGGNNSNILINKAKENRNNPTEAEKVLWQYLKGKKLGVKFRQQHLVNDFIADFVCLSKSLIIEVDGGYHNLEDQIEKDSERSRFLEEEGFKILRFKNEEVLGSIDSVLEKIKTELCKVSLSFGKGLGDRIPVFTTRPDTIFGVSFMVLAPEHDLVKQITTEDRKEAVENYIAETAKRSERERMADVKKITGEFTGAYAIHPFTGKEIPIWIADYVLAGYGTGAVMAVPAGDERDYAFAKHFDLEIPEIFEGIDLSEEAYTDKGGKVKLQNSDFLNGLTVKEALPKAIQALEEKRIGEGKVNYRLRDAVFSRQRYWGEPVPMYFKNGIPTPMPEQSLPLTLPEVDEYLPTETGEPPLGRATEWAWDETAQKVVSNDLIDEKTVFPIELNTMPGWAGSSWYLFRYMDADNNNEFASQDALKYWQNVDLYIGGSEHATGHLLYSRFWTKFLKDRGYVNVEEPFKKLINQGMILGESAFVHRINNGYYNDSNHKLDQHGLIERDQIFDLVFNELFQGYAVSFDKLKGKEYQEVFDGRKYKLIDVFPEETLIVLKTYFNPEFALENIYFTTSLVHLNIGKLLDQNTLDFDKLDFNENFKISPSVYLQTDNKIKVSREVEKMSKSKFNVVNPDDICEEYGADTLRMYEMFLGPVEQSKPWNTNGLSGVFGFLKKFWKLYFNGDTFSVADAEPTKEEYKILHTLIKKVTDDIENFSFNTSIAAFMIAVNDLQKIKCNKRAILEPLAILIAPFAPHIAEELWERLGHTESISTVAFPEFNEKYLVEDSKKYPISFNGKMRFTLELPLDLSKEEIEKAVLADERTQKQLDGRTPKKIIVVPGKIVNLVG